jgi:DNA repair protein RecN (Recombination protein N)
LLSELRVRQLGVIDDQALVLGPGMTALTGETGAGKTLIVDAIELLLGGRADPVLVRLGAPEAVVEGRFVGPFPGAVGAVGAIGASGDVDLRDERDGPAGGGAGEGVDRSDETVDPSDEVVLGRVVPGRGRSRAYLDGRMVTSAALGAVGAELVDLHGQHAHQSLLSGARQRAALDTAAGVDLAPLQAARDVLRRLTEAQAAIGGDERTRAREAELLRFQLEELDAAHLEDPDEDTSMREEEDRLSDASAHRDALAATQDAVNGDGGAGDARAAVEGFDDDPARLAEIGDRRHTLADLRRKYGETLGDVIAYRDEARRRLDEIDSHDERAAALAAERVSAEGELRAALERVGRARRAGAGPLASAIEVRLHELALPHARFEVDVSDDPGGETVTWLLGANPGEAALPLTKVASGGELARTMLAVRLVLGGAADEPTVPLEAVTAPRTLVFDEVDAGVGGEAAVAVGRALAALGRHHQVLVVTHLPQVAAFADHHIVVTKVVDGERTRSEVEPVAGAARVVELSRMLSGQPDSETARRHAAELLGMAAGAPEPSGARRPARPVRGRAKAER